MPPVGPLTWPPTHEGLRSGEVIGSKVKSIPTRGNEEEAGRKGGQDREDILLSRPSTVKGTCDFGANQQQMCPQFWTPVSLAQPSCSQTGPQTTKWLEEEKKKKMEG